MNNRTVVCAVLICAAGAAAAVAADKPTEFSLGLSYLATTGNSESKTAGLDLDYKRTFAPWGLEVIGGYLRADSNGEETASRSFLGVRGDRALGERWKVFVGVNWLRDTFAGLDNRYVLGAGVTYGAVKTDTQELSFDLGVAWNSEDLTTGASNDYLSGLAGMAYTWTISPTSKLTEKLSFLPSFEDSQDWRLASETAVEAAISAKLALKLGFQYLYDNLPVPGFEKTDTKTAISLVVKL